MSKLLISLIIIELLLSIYLGITIYNIRRNCFKLVNYKNSEIFDTRSANSYLNQLNNFRLQTENSEISISDVEALKNLDFNLVLRLHENICIKCYTTPIEQSILTIKKNNQKLIILGSFQFHSVMNAIITDLGLSEFENFNLKDKITLPADSANAPYFFTVSNNKTVKNTYILQKDNLQNLYFYFKSVNNSSTQ